MAGHAPVQAIFEVVGWVLEAGVQWHHIPPFGVPAYQTCHRYFQSWVQQGLFKRLVRWLHRDPRLRGKRKKGGAKIGKTKRGKGTKIMALTTRTSQPFSVYLASASSHAITLVDQAIEARFTAHMPRRH